MTKLNILLLCALCSILVFGVFTTGSKVKVQLLYECLCDGCRQDMTKTVIPLYHQLSDYMDLHLYPYGNARMHEENGKVVVECQHGPEECYGNKIHACAIDILKDIGVYGDFIACTMKEESTDEDAKQCASDLKIDVDPILQCAKSDRGQQLLIETGKESEKYKHDYVPYVLLNGQGLDYKKDLKTEICKLLNPPPPACSKQ